MSDSVIPSSCFAVCQTAFSIAQRVGKSSQLCEPDSEFIQSVNDCSECVDEGNSDAGSARNLAGLDEFLEFCDVPASTVTGVFTSPNGDAVTLVYVVPSVGDDATTTDQATESAGPTETLPADDGSDERDEDSGGLSPGALAGAIAGPILALLLIVAIGVVGWRKRWRPEAQAANKKPEPFEKPMLHSDCIPKQMPSELGDEAPAQELEGDVPSPTEVVGSEVRFQELGGSGDKDGGKAKGDSPEP